MKKKMQLSSGGMANDMREAREAADYNEWLATEIRASIDDPRPSRPHDDFAASIDARITALPAKHKPKLARRKHT